MLAVGGAQRYRTEILMRAPHWKLPAVWLADLFFGVGRAISTGWTVVRILDQSGQVLWERPFGSGRKAAHETWVGISQDLEQLDPETFAAKYQLRLP